MTSCTISAGETDSPRDIFELALPTFQEVDGYRGIVLGDERNVIVVTLWASAEHMAESDRFAALLQQAESTHRGWEAGETAHYAVLVSDLQR